MNSTFICIFVEEGMHVVTFQSGNKSFSQLIAITHN